MSFYLMHFQRGDLVWGKMKGFPHWPGFIVDPHDINKENQTTDKLWIFWFADHSVSQIKPENICSFVDGFAKNFHKCLRKHIKKSLDEAFYVLAEINEMKYQKEKYLEWAENEFYSIFDLQFRWMKKELPQIVEDALSLSKRDNIPNESDQQVEGPKVLIEKVRNEEKMLQEICIACCNTNAIGDESHPLFIGRVCEMCQKDVSRANKLPLGRMQVYCVICGQGGDMVYCSIKTCKRGYCKECIHYLDCKNAFPKIVCTEYWECYFCSPVKTKKCLIQKRAMKRKVPSKLLFENEENNASSANESKIASIIQGVLDGTTDLDEICIACCEEELKIIGRHPLFVGGLCTECYQDVMAVCNLPYGVIQKYCIVCGQGGHLVFCDDAQCLRAYCRQCIEWLDLRHTFESIKRKKFFLCYFCITTNDAESLIKKRFCGRSSGTKTEEIQNIESSNHFNSEENTSSFDETDSFVSEASVSNNIYKNGGPSRRSNFLKDEETEDIFKNQTSVKVCPAKKI